MSISEKLSDALKKTGLLILFKTKNNQLDYSIMNRPEPITSEISDPILATAIVDAVQRFEFVRVKPPNGREKVSRDDGRTVAYRQLIDFDWEDGTVKSSVGQDMMRKVMSLIVMNLVKNATPPPGGMVN